MLNVATREASSPVSMNYFTHMPREEEGKIVGKSRAATSGGRFHEAVPQRSGPVSWKTQRRAGIKQLCNGSILLLKVLLIPQNLV